MMDESIKKGFYLSKQLDEEWKSFHYPSKDYSPSAAAGMLMYLAADFPKLREALRKLAFQKDIRGAIKKARILLVNSVLDDLILEEADVDNIKLLKLLKKNK